MIAPPQSEPLDLPALPEREKTAPGGLLRQSDPLNVVTSGALQLTPLPETRYWRVQNWSSQALPSPRDLFIHLPEAYFSELERCFPILLLHDGQNLFDGALSYIKGNTWRCGESADAEVAAGRVESLILVGVGNAGAERMAEYTPTADTRLGGGKGRLYAEALVNELLPVLRRDLRLAEGPGNTGIAGSSLGGLISLAIGLQYPQVFGKVGALSPSIWWDHRSILDEVRALPAKLPLRVWLDMGTAEGQIHLRDTDLLAYLLERKGWKMDARSTPPKPAGLKRFGSPFERYAPAVDGPADLHYERVPNGVHNESAWAARFGEVLRFLFPAELRD